MNIRTTPNKRIYGGLFIVTLATLMQEILLTRIFSVTMWYHFAFVAVSVAMFGMTAGALAVYLFPSYFTVQRATYHLALSALLYAITIVISFLTHLCMPFVINFSLAGLWLIVMTCLVLAVPFIFSGICVCLAITKFPRQVGQVYAADLMGAGAGCVCLIYVLKITDGPTAVIVTAILASCGAMLFALAGGCRKILRLALLVSLSLLIFVIAQAILAKHQVHLLRLVWVKGALEPPSLYEKWNSFSRITVFGGPNVPDEPLGWGFSQAYRYEGKVRQLILQMDATAGTVLTGFDGDVKRVDYLKYDIVNLAHHIRPDSKVLVIGTGGGRDILSALVFRQKSVTGVEINPDIIDIVNNRFGDFVGHLDRIPGVRFIQDEARSWLERQKEHFDIIQVSLIDTWAATAAGAFVLTENALYTLEAWQLFLNRLTPKGVLTFSRYYFWDRPGEMYRLVSLASSSLRRLGVENPKSHIVVIRRMYWHTPQDPSGGIGTILVSQSPFSQADLKKIKETVSQMQFDVVLAPDFSLDPTFAAIAEGKDLNKAAAPIPIDIRPPTDDKPFFFHMLRLRHVFDPALWQEEIGRINMQAVFVLGILLIISVGLTLLSIALPLRIIRSQEQGSVSVPLLFFFGAIGFGFMLVEISQMQRLSIFLGHPTYSLSVVLFVLLASSGLGSYFTHKIKDSNLIKAGVRPLFLLLCTLTLFGLLTPQTISALRPSTIAIRILVAAGMLFPIGVFMGMAFPLGMKLASFSTMELTPWLWGINGATSVCASVLGVAIALNSGISVAFWSGVFCYVVALVAYFWSVWAVMRNFRVPPIYHEVQLEKG